MSQPVPVQVIRDYVYVYAAVAPMQGHMVSLILPEPSTAMMNLFLEHVSRSFPDHFIVMQVDQAGWHRSQGLLIPANIRLIPQPAYSPEVKPVEHVWDELREKYFHNCVFPSLDELIETLCQGLTAPPMILAPSFLDELFPSEYSTLGCVSAAFFLMLNIIATFQGLDLR